MYQDSKKPIFHLYGPSFLARLKHYDVQTLHLYPPGLYFFEATSQRTDLKAGIAWKGGNRARLVVF